MPGACVEKATGGVWLPHRARPGSPGEGAQEGAAGAPESLGPGPRQGGRREAGGRVCLDTTPDETADSWEV